VECTEEFALATKSEDQIGALRTRLAGKPLLGFDTASWGDCEPSGEAGRVAFAMVGGKDGKRPSRRAQTKSD
jgi:hypothetical protein